MTIFFCFLPKNKYQKNGSHIDKITELNHLDVDLYEFAKKLFDERFAEINEI